MIAHAFGYCQLYSRNQATVFAAKAEVRIPNDPSQDRCCIEGLYGASHSESSQHARLDLGRDYTMERKGAYLQERQIPIVSDSVARRSVPFSQTSPTSEGVVELDAAS